MSLAPIVVTRADDGAVAKLEFVTVGEVCTARLHLLKYGEIREQRVHPDRFPRGWRNTAERRMWQQNYDMMTPLTLITERLS